MARAGRSSIDLVSVLSSMTGRHVKIGEIIAALKLGRSTYYEQCDDGRLISADNMLRLAAELDINPIELLLHCGLISAQALADCAGKFDLDIAVTPPVPTNRNRRFQRRSDAPPI